MLFSWTVGNQGNSLQQTIAIESPADSRLFQEVNGRKTLSALVLNQFGWERSNPLKCPHAARSPPHRATLVSGSQRTAASLAASSAIFRTMFIAGPGNLQGERNLSGYRPLEEKFTDGFYSFIFNSPQRPFHSEI